MTDPENRYGDTPLGRSVEEVERESGNPEPSAGTNGELWQNGEVALPAIVNANASAVPAVIVPDIGQDASGSADRGGGEGSA